MKALFEWDTEKADVNLRKHGIDFDEAVTVFIDRLALTIPDPDHSQDEDRFIVIGESRSKRLLVVACTERLNKIRVISARKANRSERNRYEEDIN